MSNTHFISIDWGTTNLRIRYINSTTLYIVEEITSTKGIKTIYNEWKLQGGEREIYYLNFLKSQINLFKTQINPSTPIVISGMASSSIGLRELPYANLPFDISGKTVVNEHITHSSFPYPITLISGVKSEDDVIRGEETELIGIAEQNDIHNDIIFITPGTHSKHIILKQGYITNFHTYMTGELFNIIAENSILKGAIKKSDFNPTTRKSFNKGVLAAESGTSILNTLFKTRTNILFKTQTEEENFYYLSGLLIGEELTTLKRTEFSMLKLCAGGNLFELYLEALKALDLFSKTEIVSKEIVDKAAIKGQWKIIQHLNI